MSHEDWQRMWDLFHTALELPKAERAPFLDEACGSNAGLRDEIDGLLASHEQPEAGRDRLESPLWREAVADPVEALIGKTVGPYRVLAVVGEGGMGVVYEAEQTTPMRRRVALKVIKPGMDTREVIARFEAERQALAMMNHPNIAKVLDAGATADDRPFFVMEYVDGVPITRYCDSQRSTTEGRLDLFVRVCQAVQHAHQKGIIHRDLKPSNVLVTLQEGDPVPQVIDFGVAKAISQRLTERTIYTEVGRLIGTPEYMSPEQAQMSELSVDTRTDIYSLGVLLYELLIGRLPFDPEMLRKGGYAEIQRIVCEEEPAKPSTRLRNLEGAELEDVAGRRRTTGVAAVHELRGDLDWITMKAMEKDPARRYATASELAADVQRHQQSQPVLAAAPGAVYRFRKFARRHRAGVLLTALVGLLVVGFGVTMTVQTLRLARSLNATERERSKATQVSEFLVELLQQTDPDIAQGETITVREVLDAGSERIAGELEDQPEVRAMLMNTMGQVYVNLGDYDKGAVLLERALKIRRGDAGVDPEELAESLNNVATAYFYLGRYDESEKILRQVLADRRERLGDEHAMTAQSLNNLGDFLVYGRGELEQARQVHERALAIREQLFGEMHEDVGESLNDLGILHRRQGNYAAAEECYRRAIKIWRATLGEEHPDVAKVMNNLALLLHVKGDFAASEEMFRETLERRRRLLGDEHSFVGLTLSNMGQLLRDAGKYEEAESVHREGLAVRQKALGEEHPDVADSLANLSAILEVRGKYEEAEPLEREALAMRRRLLGDEHPRIALSLSHLAQIALRRGQYAEAESLANQAIEMQDKLLDEAHPDLAASLQVLAEAHAALGEQAAAERRYRESIEMRRELFGDHPSLARALTSLGRYRIDRGEPSAAEPPIREAVEMLHRLYPDGGILSSRAESDLGACLTALGRHEEAEPLLQSSVSALGEETGRPLALRRLVSLYEAWGRPGEAARYRASGTDQR